MVRRITRLYHVIAVEANRKYYVHFMGLIDHNILLWVYKRNKNVNHRAK